MKGNIYLARIHLYHAGFVLSVQMLKDLNKEKGGKSGKKHKQHSKLVEKDVPVPETDNVEEDINLHCVDRTVRELEFVMVGTSHLYTPAPK